MATPKEAQAGTRPCRQLSLPRHVAQSRELPAGSSVAQSEPGGDARARSRAPPVPQLQSQSFQLPPQRQWPTARPSMGSPPGGVRTTVARHPRTGARRNPAQVGPTLAHASPLPGGAGWGRLGPGGRRAWWQRVAAPRPGLRTLPPRASQGGGPAGWRAGWLPCTCGAPGLLAPAGAQLLRDPHKGGPAAHTAPRDTCARGAHEGPGGG